MSKITCPHCNTESSYSTKGLESGLTVFNCPKCKQLFQAYVRISVEIGKPRKI